MHALLSQLHQWRLRERLVRLAFGGSCLLAVMAFALAVCCAVDYAYDRFADVPKTLRFAMFAAQAMLACILAYFLLLRPWQSAPIIDDLAMRAEKAIPEFDHRLVTAIQLNRKTARTEGMSQALIAAVTREAGEMASHHNLVSLIDYKRLIWGGLALMPVILLWMAALLLWPKLVPILLQRQALLNVAIPRSVALENKTIPLWPAGEEVEIRFEATGRVNESKQGTVFVTPENESEDQYPLVFNSWLGEGKALYTAKIPPSSVNFSFRAKLADARTGEAGHVRFEPRPVVKNIEAWATLPEFLGLVPSGPRAGQRYERFQNQGEVQALAGSSVRVRAEFQKPVAKAELLLLERPADHHGERLLERRRMAIAPDGFSAENTFDLKPNMHLYRIEVEDANGFKNLTPPTRGLLIQPDEPPKVTLLQESFKDPDSNAPDGKGPIDDYEVNGMPIVAGGPFLVAFNARSPMGIGNVSIYYRVNDEEEWSHLPLKPVTADPERMGPFVPELGLFQKSGKMGQVELYKLPSPSPETEPGELEAGGRYNFQTRGLSKQTPTGRAKLDPGDRVEFYVAAADKAPDPSRPLGRSESRIKSVVTFSQLEEWNRLRDQSKERLKEIEEKQRGVFQSPKP